MKAGFIGLGNMGRRMVKNLQAAGHELVVNDLYPEAAASALDAGAQWADSPRQVARQCRVIMMSLPGPPEVEAVVTGDNGVLAAAQSGDIIVDLSTNSPSLVRGLAEMAAAQRVAFLDAPVSGGTVGAEKGTLAIMVGGEEAAFHAVQPLLSSIGQSLFYLGPSGSGTITKLMNNLASLATYTIVSEAMVVGAKAGMDPRKMVQVMMASTARSYCLENFSATVMVGNFAPGFMIDLGVKDLKLATALAAELRVPAPMANGALQRYIEAQAKGLGRQATPAVVKLLEEVAGLEVRG